MKTTLRSLTEEGLRRVLEAEEAEGPGYWQTLKELSLKAKLKGPMVHDARIAALCQHHGVKELWSADRDFTRFTALKIRNPL